MEFRIGEVGPGDKDLFESVISEVERRKHEMGAHVRPVVCMSPRLYGWMQQTCDTQFETPVYTFPTIPMGRLYIVPKATALRWRRAETAGGAYPQGTQTPSPTGPIIPDREA